METVPTSHYDVIVIGAGPAGVSAAIELAKLGKEVAIIDKDFSSPGKLSGSIISNTLLYLSYLYHRYKTKTSFFLTSEHISDAFFDIKKVKRYIESISAKIFKSYRDDLDEHNIKIIESLASFVNNNTLELLNEDKSKSLLTFDKCIVATGSYPKTAPFATGKKLIDPLNVVNLEKIPASITIIGGGFIGIEYATIFKRLGCTVKIIESKDRILHTFDDLIVKRYEEILKKDGITIIKSKTVQNIERIGNKCLIFLEDDTVESEEVFVAIGRVPNLKMLNITNASVEINNDMPVVDKTLKSTTNENIYFAGDAAGKHMFLNWAYHSAEVIVNDIVGKRQEETIFTFPKVLYTDPEIACVGITEQEASSMKLNFHVIRYSFSDLEMSIITGHSKGFIKVIFEKNTKLVLGAHMIGKGSTELLPIFSLIIKLKLKIDDISQHLFSYPAFAEALVDISNKMKEQNA